MTVYPDPPTPALPQALRPGSPVLEACRLLRLNLSAGQGDDDRFAPLLMIAPAPDPACAQVALGLAAVLAEEQRRSLLVDADLHNPLLHKLIGIARTPGLAEALAAPTDPPAPAPVGAQLWVLPAGAASPDTATLLRPQVLAQLTGDLAARFDVVIYHIAGLPVNANTLLLAPHIGTAIFTVRAGIDTAEQIRSIRRPLERAGVQILGFALVGDPDA